MCCSEDSVASEDAVAACEVRYVRRRVASQREQESVGRPTKRASGRGRVRVPPEARWVYRSPRGIVAA
jgi:hypothetical protein